MAIKKKKTNETSYSFRENVEQWVESAKKNPPQAITFGVVTFFILVYLSGIIAQIIENGLFQKYDMYNNPIPKEYTFNPLVVVAKALFSETGKAAFAPTLITLGLLILVYKVTDRREFEDERGFIRSKDGTYGTARWMNLQEVKDTFNLGELTHQSGYLYGKYKGLTVTLPPDTWLFNQHHAVIGAAGTGKSRSFSRNNIIQAARRNESIVITDPKGELYNSMSGFLEHMGYTIKVFNLVNFETSDSWNPLAEITKDPSNQEIMAQTFAQVIIENTMDGPSKMDYWDKGEMNLLKALALYVAISYEGNKTMGSLYQLVSNEKDNILEEVFDNLPPGHPANQPWQIFKKATAAVRSNITQGLGVRLQQFQANLVRDITSTEDIDLELPATEKCAYFVISSDQDSTFSFLSSLYFTFLFIRLQRYADRQDNQQCNVKVNCILDEFPNIGKIPDFPKKIATLRGRGVRIAVMIQSVTQLEEMYQGKGGETILANCDIQVFLGANDITTARYMSDSLGTMTIQVEGQQVTKHHGKLHIPGEYRQTSGVGKRSLMNPDEVRTLNRDQLILLIRGSHPLKLLRFDYSEHPVFAENKHWFAPVNILNRQPQYKLYREVETLLDDVWGTTNPDDYNHLTKELLEKRTVEHEEKQKDTVINKPRKAPQKKVAAHPRKTVEQLQFFNPADEGKETTSTTKPEGSLYENLSSPDDQDNKNPTELNHPPLPNTTLEEKERMEPSFSISDLL